MRAFSPLVLLAFGLAACEPATIVLVKPATGQLAECYVEIQIVDLVRANESCAQGYAAQGYQRVSP